MWIREHLPHIDHEAGQAESDPGSRPRPPVGTEGDEPFPGYSRMSPKQLIPELHNHPQAELAAAEQYELTHGQREAVLNKLRYLRTPEPWQGYDAMPEEEILDRLTNADDNTVKRVRDYEHKFKNRPRIVQRAIHMHHQRLAELGPRELPAYMPGGGVSRSA